MSLRRWRSPFVELGLFGVAALLLFAYEYLDRVARQEAINPLEPLIEQATGVMGSGLLFFAVRRFARRVPIVRGAWPSRVVLHAGALVVYSLIHTTFNWVSRLMLFAAAGLGLYDYGIMPVRYLMEFPIDVISYVCFVMGVWVADEWRAERTRALDAARLESQLARARLQNLHLQLQPHFLFNALNTISSTMYEDAAAADAMLARLAELLRYTLRTAEAHEVPLSVELDALEHYLVLIESRFGDDFACRREIESAARRVLVPSLLLQPLVENAVRHGNLSHVGRGRVVIRARRRGDALHVEMDDDGPGVDPKRDVLRDGVGLPATAERLRLLYGDRQRFEAHNIAGGFRVSLVIPWREAAAVDPVHEVDVTDARAHR